MSPSRRLIMPASVLCLGALLGGFSGCGSSSSQNVVPPGYTLGASPLIPGDVIAGTSATSTIAVTPLSGYTGTVTLLCSSITGGIPAPVCSFGVSPVTINGMAPVTSTLTVSTSSGTPGGPYTVTVSATDSKNLAPANGSQALSLITTAVIQHVVIIFQENRTPDNLFHDSVLIANGADIASSGLNSDGDTIPLLPEPLGIDYDLGHRHNYFLAMYDGGKMDGANNVGVTCTPGVGDCPLNPQYMYVQSSDVAPYFQLAEQYTFGDRMFQSNQGPSFPAHQFILSGTSAPSATSNLFAAENPTHGAGCAAPAGALVALIDPNGNESSSMYPCFEHPTLSDELQASALTWRYYAPNAGSIWTAPNAIEHICGPNAQPPNATACVGSEWTNNVILYTAGNSDPILTDISNNQLAAVSWVIPSGQNSDHAGSVDATGGPSWVATIVNAIGSSPYWSNTAIIITWDDWGGWYDHVAPTVIDNGTSWGSGYVYGFRVPLIVVSPYAKPAYISHVTHDFGSILSFIEKTFGLPSLGYADAYADDLSDCFNFNQSPLQFQTIAAPLGAEYFLNDRRPPTDPDDD